ncbi:MAG: DUF177 domain-containing protein [Bacteroidia bacterium]|nr:DUF177 domain-containing protein [Bacteroidia bacterium]
MAGKRKYIISFSGLSAGKHEYEYNITDTFFEAIEYSEIKKGDVRIDVRLNKQSAMLIFDFIVRGEVTLSCDRCGDDCRLKIKGEYQQFVKTGGGNYNNEEDGGDMLILPSNEGEIDIEHFLYEYAILSLPAKRVHDTLADCNKEVIKKLKEIEVPEQYQTNDPRWDKLKQIKFNN